jgi:hypothetical protein
MAILTRTTKRNGKEWTYEFVKYEINAHVPEAKFMEAEKQALQMKPSEYLRHVIRERMAIAAAQKKQ